MLIHINMENSNFRLSEREETSHFFSEVARVSREGYHRIVINNCLSGWVIDEFSSGKTGLQTCNLEQIKQIGKRYSMSASAILDQTIPLLEVVYGEHDIKRISCNRWQIGHKKLIENKLHEQTLLLVEGPDDCKLYKHLLPKEAERRGFGSIDFYPIPCGGKPNMVKVLKEAVHKDRVQVCIFDSDKIAADVEENHESISARRHVAEQALICHVDCTPGHEAENFLPMEIVHSLSTDSRKKHTENLIRLIDEQQCVEPCNCLWLFYDIKNGIEKWKIKYEEHIENNTSEWIKQNIKNIIKENTISKLPVYGEILNKFVNNNSKLNEFSIFIDNSEYWRMNFSSWFETGMWFLSSDKKVRKDIC